MAQRWVQIALVESRQAFQQEVCYLPISSSGQPQASLSSAYHFPHESYVDLLNTVDFKVVLRLLKTCLPV